MSTIDYPLKPSPVALPTFDWLHDPFYETAVVLGIDIGLEGIGIWLRQGRKPIYTRTFLFETPEAAPLQGRRGLRAGRRCRQAERRREVMLQKFCADFGLPWVSITDKGRDDGPFRFRWIATRKDTGGLRDVKAFSACLRHIIRHRGYDWHAPEDGGEYPWGDEAKAKDAIQWAKDAFCKSEHADDLRYRLTDCGWPDKDRQAFDVALAAAVNRYNNEGIGAVLAQHFAEAKNNLRPAARRFNFPREMVQDHLEEIVKRHSKFIGGESKVAAALERLDKIINDHRKDEAERARLFQRKVKPCPLSGLLFSAPAKCDPGKLRPIRRFKLLEFLATRTFVQKDGTRLLASAEIFKWLLNEVLEADIKALDSKDKIQRPGKIRESELKKQFTTKYDSTGKIELAGKGQSHNEDFFSQLSDLLWPKMSELGARASLCARSAEAMFDYAVKDGYNAGKIAARLKEKRFDRGGKPMSFYEIRQSAAAGYGVYKQVEFLLGRWTKKGDRLAVPGKLRQVFAQLIREGKLPATQTAPDYVVIETIGDMPRNREQAKEIQEEQKKRREFKDKLRDKFKDYKRGNLSKEEASKRLLLYEQQRGRCPYTGRELGENPFAQDLEIDHIFPRQSGGLSIMENLVLTHRSTNGEKGKRTPYEAFGGKTDSPQWKEILQRVRQMQWNKQKQEYFAWGTLAENYDASGKLLVPDFNNTTRMAQLARQLRYEAARWLGIADDDAKARQFIGTPTGYQTSVCREAWGEQLPEDFYPKKNRDNLRHHMWDAAVLSHIPPGKGLNHVRCHGIFDSKTDHNGDIQMTALPGLGPNLKQFEKETAGHCLVKKIQPDSDKKSRYQQTIYSPPDEKGVLWARDSLDKLADKENLLHLLRNAGIDEKQLPETHFNAWLEKRQAQFFTREEALAAVEVLALPADHQIPLPIFEEWWTDRLKGDKKRVTDKSLRALLAKAKVPKALVSDQQLAGALINRGNPGPLTRKDGTVIRGVSGSASNMTPMAVIPHRNHKGETIGYKLATESFIRAEIWTTERCDKKGQVIKDENGKSVLEYHRRLIPHPRGLKNLRLRVLQSTGKRLSWERALTDAEITELGLDGNADVKKLRRDYEKAVKLFKKESAKAKDKATELDLAAGSSEIGGQPRPLIISLRKIFTGLPPKAKRLTNANGADISRFAIGDLLLVPLTQEAEICEPNQTSYRELWFRVAAIKTNGQIQLVTAERKQTKPLTEQEKKDGKQLTAEQEWLLKAGLKQPGNDELIAYLLQHTRRHDQPPHSAQ